MESLAPYTTLTAPAQSGASTNLRLAPLFGDGMVLQRDSEVAIWGTLGQGGALATVTLRADWSEQPITAAVDTASGRWSATLRTPGAGGPHTLTIKAGEQELVLRDVLLGEVWLCSGQSNMEMPLAPTGWSAGVLDFDKEVAAAEHPRIRQFDVPNALALTPQATCGGSWVACTPQTAGTFSAVGYFFARELERELDVPIGIVNATWGGTRIEAWMSPECARGFPHLARDVAVTDAERAKPGGIEGQLRVRQAAWWGALATKESAAGAAAWSSAEFDDSAWKLAAVPGTWEASGEGEYDGSLWFRRSFVIPAEFAGQALALELGAIDDMDTTWIDGVRVGGLEKDGCWATPRRYDVPPQLATAGPHVLAVRAVDTGGVGGFSGRPEQLALVRRDDATRRVPLAGEWRSHRGVALAELGAWPADALHPNFASVLANAMLAPLAPFKVRGFLWYQGESNRDTHALYTALQSALIADWRAAWHDDALPFYFVQIAPFGYDGDRGETGALRDAQRRTLSVPHTGMAVTMDVGDPSDIHPRNKQDVGKRLARLALERDYGRAELVACGPLYRSCEREGAKLRVRFEHAEGGLISSADHLQGFEIAGADRKFVTPRAELEGESVLLWHPDVPEPVAVRHGFSAGGQTVLFNQSWLPAAAFRSDDWPLE